MTRRRRVDESVALRAGQEGAQAGAAHVARARGLVGMDVASRLPQPSHPGHVTRVDDVVSTVEVGGEMPRQVTGAKAKCSCGWERTVMVGDRWPLDARRPVTDAAFARAWCVSAAFVHRSRFG